MTPDLPIEGSVRHSHDQMGIKRDDAQPFISLILPRFTRR